VWIHLPRVWFYYSDYLPLALLPQQATAAILGGQHGDLVHIRPMHVQIIVSRFLVHQESFPTHVRFDETPLAPGELDVEQAGTLGVDAEVALRRYEPLRSDGLHHVSQSDPPVLVHVVRCDPGQQRLELLFGEAQRVDVLQQLAHLPKVQVPDTNPGKIQSTLRNIQSTLRNIQSTLGNIQSILRNIQSTSGNIQSTLGNIQSTSENIQSTLGNIQSTLGNVQSTLGNIRCLP
jgi:uncharacterized protein YukE